MGEDLEARVTALEAELAALKAAFLEAMADPPLTRADRALLLAEALDALERSERDGAPDAAPPSDPL
ncbi:MAG: hypothetical protein AAFR17_18420 [Pseudomonadota bacterium]